MRKMFFAFLAMAIIVSGFSLIAGAEELTNVAEGKSYTLECETSEADYGYTEGTDSGFGDGPNAIRQRLTDGMHGLESTRTVKSGAQKTKKAFYVIDLGSVVNGISKLNMDMYYRTDWGIQKPIGVEYALLTDGVNYTTEGKILVADSVERETPEPWVGYDFTLNLSTPKSARYVKMIAEGGNYIWSTEMQVFASGEETSDPESESSTPAAESEEQSSESTTSEPGESSTPGSTGSSEVTQTGDDDGMTFYIIIAAAAVLLIVTVILTYKKKAKQ
ncbi:MAG TPA: hypothetical protein DD733_10990 [Clostridiales bacterium]|nr:hypothetical protein [Clostridiales bacterium]